MAVRRRRTVARKRNAPRRRTHVRNAPRRVRRRRSLRNPYPLAGAVINPRRRRRARRNPVVRHHRRHMRRNPAILGLTLPPIKSVLFAGVGFIGIPVVNGFITPLLPASMQPSTPVGRYGMYAASGLLLTFAVKQFAGASEAQMTAIGAAAFIIKQALVDFMPGVIPGLSGYVSPNMGAYVRGNQPTMAQLGMPQASFPGSQGSSNPIPNRFSRF